MGLEDAVKLLSLPRTIGEHPEDGEEIVADLGRYGPYVRRKKDYRSVEFEQLFELSLDDAVEIFKQPKGGRKRKVLKELGEHPETGKPMQVLDGRYGPYIKMGRTNASLPKDESPEDITVERAVELIAEKKAKKKKKKGKKKKKK